MKASSTLAQYIFHISISCYYKIIFCILSEDFDGLQRTLSSDHDIYDFVTDQVLLATANDNFLHMIYDISHQSTKVQDINIKCTQHLMCDR
jgi:hypothetical protein